MNTRHLRSFLRVAETKSISRAAVSLGIAQPSLSQHILRLEDEVGQTLLKRTARGITLTEAGSIFLTHAMQILRSVEQGIDDVRQAAEPSGSVTLAVPYSISRMAGVTLVEAFLEHAPRVALRLVEASTGQIRGWLEEGKVDLGILHELGTLSELSLRPIATEELLLVKPAGKSPRIDTNVEDKLRALGAMPLILPGPQHGLRQTIEQAAARLGIELMVKLEIDAIALIPALVAQGHGYSILPGSALADSGAVASGQVVTSRIGRGMLRRNLCLARNSTKLITSASTRCEELTIRVLDRLIDKGVWDATTAVRMTDETANWPSQSNTKRTKGASDGS
ncbi:MULTISPECIES: LysR family transcriptional regulator [unclassified Novosphingobium]|uniref:LysR family transcriptional regulator n=1 Tax=unclassified Novosphingobium TaxID=2644732 RepID=UPI001356D6F6|nr:MULTISPECIES: LysR family transcriptional regulator [unclassified Novosphingobium]